ncbi:MAG: DUF948 domain-containing protein [Oscillatoriales cyanobacterium]|nr:MAG: DUF948 domain-containing protein [Oscillatoriales cyanobacterium]
MIDPLFWLGLSFLIVSICLAIALAVAIPALQELGRAARSAEKLFDTLTRELPPTLEAIRLTGLEISDLTDDMTSGVQSAGQVVQKVDDGLDRARRQARRVGSTARRAAVGLQAAWQALTQPNRDRRRLEPRADGRNEGGQRGRDRLASTDRSGGDRSGGDRSGGDRYGLPSGQPWGGDEQDDRYPDQPYGHPEALADYDDETDNGAEGLYGDSAYGLEYEPALAAEASDDGDALDGVADIARCSGEPTVDGRSLGS